MRIFCIAATAIARETTGSGFSNTAMIGALSRITGLFPLDTVVECVRADLGKKFPPEVVDGNIAAAMRSYDEVHGE